MKCKAVQALLAAYMDGELDGGAREVVTTHLNLCPACSLSYDRLKKTLATARVWQAGPLPEGFSEAIRERAARGNKPRPVSARPVWEWPALPEVPRVAWEVAAACLLLVVGFLGGYLVNLRPAVQPAGPGVEPAGPGVEPAGAHREVLASIETLQKLKLVLIMRGAPGGVITEHSRIQARLAAAADPALARQVAEYHRAEQLIGQGRVDEAGAVLRRLVAADPSFVLARYATVTLLAAHTAPPPELPGPSDYAAMLLPELAATPERLYELMAGPGRALAHAYIEALDERVETPDQGLRQ